MFDKLNVPTISVVENMAYFVCDDCDKKHAIFGGSAKRRLIEEFGFDLSYELPILSELADSGDAGVPLVVSQPNSDAAKLFKEMASDTVSVVNRLRLEEGHMPSLETRRTRDCVAT